MEKIFTLHYFIFGFTAHQHSFGYTAPNIKDDSIYMDTRCGDILDISLYHLDTLEVFLTANLTYDNDMNCSLVFTTIQGDKLELNFNELITEPGYDLLYIHDGSSSYSPYIAGYQLKDVIAVSCGENGWDITIDMVKLRKIYPNAKASDIYLGDNTCTGLLTGDTLLFTQGLRECLTTEMKRNNVLIYHNELIYAEHDPLFNYIIRHYNWTAGVECDVNRNNSLTGHIHYDKLDNSKEPQISGGSHYGTNMSFYLDPNFVHGVPGNPLHLSVGERLFVKVFTSGTDWTIRMRVHTCYTKPAQTSTNQMKFLLLKNGCEVDTNTHIISQTPHETRFTFEAFEYTTYHEGIQVYCDATFCGWDDFSKECTQTCNPVIRRRKSVE